MRYCILYSIFLHLTEFPMMSLRELNSSRLSHHQYSLFRSRVTLTPDSTLFSITSIAARSVTLSPTVIGESEFVDVREVVNLTWHCCLMISRALSTSYLSIPIFLLGSFTFDKTRKLTCKLVNCKLAMTMVVYCLIGCIFLILNTLWTSGSTWSLTVPLVKTWAIS